MNKVEDVIRQTVSGALADDADPYLVAGDVLEALRAAGYAVAARSTRQWSQEMHKAWHCAIPDTEKAYTAMIAAAEAEQAP